MKIVDKGVLETSFIDFSQPSEFAKKALLYPGDFGHYVTSCNLAILQSVLDVLRFERQYFC